MNDDLISRSALLELYADTEDIHFAVYNVPIPVVRQNIIDMPTIEAEPVRHGRWEWRPVDDVTSVHTCSVCSNASVTWEDANYCPNCGAKMDGASDLSEIKALAYLPNDSDLEHMTRFAMQRAINKK